MKQINNVPQLMDAMAENEVLLLYLSSRDCGVCHADLPRVEQLAEEMNFAAVSLEVNEVPEAAGQLNVFTVPAVLLFYQKKEYHRQARIIDFAELEKRMRELMER